LQAARLASRMTRSQTGMPSAIASVMGSAI
jgi:hypothetical protein